MADDKKKTKKGVWTYYKIEGNKLVKTKKLSPKNPGAFMAEHKDRRVCGKTQYTEFKAKENSN